MITKKLLKRLNLTQKNDRVFFAINNHSYFSMNDLKLLKKAINKSVNSVNAYVQNRTQPSLDVLYKIAEVLNVNPKDLLIDKNESND